MKKQRKKKKLKPRIPIEGVIKLRSYHVTEKRGKKVYNRKSFKRKIRELLEEL